MSNIYTIHDPMVNADTVNFMSETNGAAASYFYNYATVLKRYDLILVRLGSIDFNAITGQMDFVDIDRVYVCTMPEQPQEE